MRLDDAVLSAYAKEKGLDAALLGGGARTCWFKKWEPAKHRVLVEMEASSYWYSASQENVKSEYAKFDAAYDIDSGKVTLTGDALEQTPHYTYDDRSTDDTKGDIAVRVTHAPQKTFKIISEEVPGTQNPETGVSDIKIWLVPNDAPTKRVLLPVLKPVAKGDDDMVPETRVDVYVSPEEHFLFTVQRVAQGVNAVMLYTRDASDPGYHRIDDVYLTSRISAIVDHKTKGTLTGDYFFIPTGWHGEKDRYLDFDIYEHHEGVKWRGYYDTQTQTFTEIKGDFRPTAPRNPGELFPQTRQRKLPDADVASWSYAKVRYAINEIYARHGFPFADAPALAHQFAKFSWYRLRERYFDMARVEKELSPIEQYNLRVLSRRRDKVRPKGH